MVSSSLSVDVDVSKTSGSVQKEPLGITKEETPGRMTLLDFLTNAELDGEVQNASKMIKNQQSFIRRFFSAGIKLFPICMCFGCILGGVLAVIVMLSISQVNDLPAIAQKTLPTATLCEEADVLAFSTIDLICPIDEEGNPYVIKSVEFASIGTPQGRCGTYEHGACNNSIATFVEETCVGEAYCTIPPNGDDLRIFGSPCPTSLNNVYIEVTCQQNYTYNVTINRATRECTRFPSERFSDICTSVTYSGIDTNEDITEDVYYYHDVNAPTTTAQHEDAFALLVEQWQYAFTTDGASDSCRSSWLDLMCASAFPPCIARTNLKRLPFSEEEKLIDGFASIGLHPYPAPPCRDACRDVKQTCSSTTGTFRAEVASLDCNASSWLTSAGLEESYPDTSPTSAYVMDPYISPRYCNDLETPQSDYFDATFNPVDNDKLYGTKEVHQVITGIWATLCIIVGLFSTICFTIGERAQHRLDKSVDKSALDFESRLGRQASLTARGIIDTADNLVVQEDKN